MIFITILIKKINLLLKLLCEIKLTLFSALLVFLNKFQTVFIRNFLPKKLVYGLNENFYIFC